MTRCIASIALLSALALPAFGADKVADKADPAATKLLADARAARAEWSHFPGFTANAEINIDGTITRAILKVSAKGKVTVETADSAPASKTATDWAKEQLASIVGHRLASGSSLDTPCAFIDDNAHHPLGRAIHVLNDEFHSSYRVRERQIIEVNREMKDSRFTITVMENRLNAEKKYLPVSYVVNSWNTGARTLKSSTTYHHTWERVGDFDLPATVLVVTANSGAPKSPSDLDLPIWDGFKSASSLKLSKFELLK
jgi:hypothetical protein